MNGLEIPLFLHAGIQFDQPEPELVSSVANSLAVINDLLSRLPVASRDFDALIKWTAELHKRRDDLWEPALYLSAAGFDIPDFDMDMDAQASEFIGLWRDFLAKVSPAVRTSGFYVVQ